MFDFWISYAILFYMDKKIEKYSADLEKYVSKVNKKLLEKLARRMAPVMARKDAATVACGDSKELERIRVNFVKKKLGVSDIEKGRKAMESVCQTMKKSRAKSRITFYYLLAVELKAVKKYLDN